MLIFTYASQASASGLVNDFCHKMSHLIIYVHQNESTNGGEEGDVMSHFEEVNKFSEH